MGKCLVGFLMVVAGFTNVTMAEEFPSKDIYINASDIFVPEGQTADKDAFVVASGMFPNSCYSMKGAEVNTITEFEHRVRLKATVTQAMCLMVIIPYSKQVTLGRLSRGTHTLKFVNGDDTYFERTLTIQ